MESSRLFDPDGLAAVAGNLIFCTKLCGRTTQAPCVCVHSAQPFREWSSKKWLETIRTFKRNINLLSWNIHYICRSLKLLAPLSISIAIRLLRLPIQLVCWRLVCLFVCFFKFYIIQMTITISELLCLWCVAVCSRGHCAPPPSFPDRSSTGLPLMLNVQWNDRDTISKSKQKSQRDKRTLRQFCWDAYNHWSSSEVPALTADA